MALVVTIGGRPVYSDKLMQAIVNSCVTFTDGSWCDVGTGQVHNTGSGYINIGGPDMGSDVETITEGPTRVFASALELDEVVADVEVTTGHGNDIEYTITGPADHVKTIRAGVRSGTLVIKGGTAGSSGGGAHTVVSDGDIVIGRGMVVNNVFGRSGMTAVVGGGGNAATITVKVPRGTLIVVNHVRGRVNIGDTYGPLAATVRNNNIVQAGRVTSARGGREYERRYSSRVCRRPCGRNSRNLR